MLLQGSDKKNEIQMFDESKACTTVYYTQMFIVFLCQYFYCLKAY